MSDVVMEESMEDRDMELETRRSALGDAEHTCVCLLDDLLTGIFQEMQVRVQNTALFTTTARQMCALVFQGVQMSACEASDSLDRSGRQQILKPQRRTRSASTPLLFLRRLLYFLEKRVDRVGLELQHFPSSQAVAGRTGDAWCIPVDKVSVFLQLLVSKGLVSAVPSTITFVMDVNREVLDAKNARVTLSHLQQLVHKAVLTAEEELETGTEGPDKVTLKLPGSGPEVELLSSYLEEMPPRAVEMDRRAPGQVVKKALLNARERAISRKVRLLMAPSPRLGSRWKTVRHKLIVPTNDTADMEGDILSNKPTTDTSVEHDETPDTAALSNIFALGTPRQLSAQEHARRNDLLAHLEREEARSKRRATSGLNSSLESDDATCSSQADQDFQAYVTANSIVTTGLSPTRPQENASRGRGRTKIQRSKFELERETLPFSVCDGTNRVPEEQERLSAAICSPIKRPRASVMLPPETPGRPIQTASTLAQLPQLDSSRLAIGVSAVVHGVEKRGPPRRPSRNSRLQLHNYSAAVDGVEEALKNVEEVNIMPFSPVRTSTREPSKEDTYRLPVIPIMSPIRASPHRKHVGFKAHKGPDNERISPKAHVRQRPLKQQVWESTTRSPPRTRNQSVSGKDFRKIQSYEEEPMAPRRNVLTNECED